MRSLRLPHAFKPPAGWWTDSALRQLDGAALVGYRKGSSASLFPRIGECGATLVVKEFGIVVQLKLKMDVEWTDQASSSIDEDSLDQAAAF